MNLKRLMLARDYWLNVKPEWVDLHEAHSLNECGLIQESGSVACVGGWLESIPEFREIVGQDWHGADGDFHTIADFLGLPEKYRWWNPETFRVRGHKTGLFDPKTSRLAMSDHQEGLERLEALIAIAEAEEQVGQADKVPGPWLKQEVGNSRVAV